MNCFCVVYAYFYRLTNLHVAIMRLYTRLKSTVLLLFFLLFGAIQASIPVSYAAENIQDESSFHYVLDAGDRLRINVFGEADLSGVYNVSSEGIISFPLIGEIKAAGLSAQALAFNLESRLKDGYLRKPSVSIDIDTHRPFYIMGEVKTPGSYNYVSDMTVLKAVAMAGGFTYRAKEDEVEILRLKNGKMEPIGKISVESQTKPGDVIMVKERFF